MTHRLELTNALGDAADGSEAAKSQNPDVGCLLGEWVAQLQEGPDTALDGKDVAHLADPRQGARLVPQLDDGVEGGAKVVLRRRTLDVPDQNLKQTHVKCIVRTWRLGWMRVLETRRGVAVVQRGLQLLLFLCSEISH